MKLSKAINFLSGTVFQRISCENLLTFSRFDSIFWAPSLGSALLWALLISFLGLLLLGFDFNLILFILFSSLTLFPLSFSTSLFLAVSLFDLYSNYFHNEINRPFPGCLHLLSYAEAT